MSADFNAGSIEGTLDLDTSPFRAGLLRAREDAARFEHEKVNPRLGLDRAEFDVQRAHTQEQLTRLDHERVAPHVGLDIAEAEAKAALLRHHLASILDVGGLGKSLSGPAFAVGKASLMASALATVAAAAGPATAALVGFGAAGAVAFGGLIPPLVLFGKMVGSAYQQLVKANKAGKDLTGWAGKAQDGLKNLTSAWDKLQKAAGSPAMHFLAVAFNGLAAILPKLAPLLRTTGNGLTHVVQQVLALGKTPIFDRFLKQLQQFLHGFLQGLGPVLVNILKTFFHLFSALQPLMSMLGRGIRIATDDMRKFSAELDHGGLQPFISNLKVNLPLLGALLTGLFHGLLNLGKGLAPLAGPALAFITALVQGIGSLNIGPLAHGLGTILNIAKPLIGVLSDLLNTVFKPLGAFLGDLGTSVIAPLVHSLRAELQPAFSTLGDILSTIAPLLAAFLGSIANLANPTGVKLFTALLGGLDKIVHTLAPSLTRLAVALESVIDNGIQAILPLLPTVLKVFNALAGVAARLADMFAGVLKHKGATDVILGLTGAIWLGVKAFKAYQLAVKGIAVVTGIFEAISFGWAGLTVAQDANTASLVANKIGMLAYRGFQLAAAAATGVLTAAQWALNVAMDANPIGLVVIAIAALVAGVIYAYTHFKTFRDIVNTVLHAIGAAFVATFNFLKNLVVTVVHFIEAHWRAFALGLITILTGPLGLVVALVVTHFSQVKSFVVNTMHAIGSAVSSGIGTVVGWFKSLPGRIASLAGEMFSAGRSLMVAIFHGLESAAGAAGGFAGNIASAIWGDLKGVLNSVLPHSLSINKGPIHINVPLFPYLAKGGVTSGPMLANIGDNPGGREAVVPLDKYDLPKKGETAAAARQTHEDSRKMIDLLTAIVNHLAKGTDNAALAEALGSALSKHSEATMKKMVQMARAA